MDDEGFPPENEDRFAYSPKALARLVLSDRLRELADEAAAGVPTIHDAAARGGADLSAALDLVTLAQSVLEAAVVAERARGTSWEQIGEVLDVSRQAANAKYSAAEKEWKLGLVEPFHPTPPGRRFRTPRLPDAAYRPTDTGRELDAWARRHCDTDDQHPVTGGLPALSTVQEMNWVLASLEHLHKSSSAVDPVARLRINERKAALLDRIAAESGRASDAETAAAAHAHVHQLRTELDDHPSN